MKNNPTLWLAALLLAAATQACRQKPAATETVATETAARALAPAPVFNADSAYAFVQKQVDFGPRIPNTAAHRRAGDWLAARLKSYGFSVTEQKFDARAYDGTVLKARNLIGSLNPAASKRILLAAHWDTRPFADKDPDPRYKDKPFDGANDGGSGVGVLLEVARLLHEKPIGNLGVDIIFFDAEDWGEKEGVQPTGQDSHWALGSQYWAKNPHQAGYSAYYGILLDLVGARGATFPFEGFSAERYAPEIVRKVWDTAARLGHGSRFPQVQGPGILDDHTAVNEVLHIPMIDIVELKIGNDKTFGDYHHTHADNMQVIDRQTLRAVGQTVVQVLYNEAAGQ